MQKKIHNMIPYKISYFLLSGKKSIKDGFIRIRDENKIIRLTTKIIDSNSQYPKEFECTVDTSFDNIKNILINAGLECIITTTKFREKWTFPGCHEIVFDLWAGMPIVMEIDCKSEKLLHSSCNKLDLDINKGFTMDKYDYLYGIEKNISQTLVLTFINYKKLLDKHIVKNKNIFNLLNKKYYCDFVNKKYYNYFSTSH